MVVFFVDYLFSQHSFTPLFGQWSYSTAYTQLNFSYPPIQTELIVITWYFFQNTFNEAPLSALQTASF